MSERIVSYCSEHGLIPNEAKQCLLPHKHESHINLRYEIHARSCIEKDGYMYCALPCPQRHFRSNVTLKDIPMQDDSAIDHPSHYGGADNQFEHIKVAEALGWGYHIGNCTKYLWRVGKKDPSKIMEDLKKARWYLDRYIQLLEGQSEKK